MTDIIEIDTYNNANIGPVAIAAANVPANDGKIWPLRLVLCFIFLLVFAVISAMVMSMIPMIILVTTPRNRTWV